MQFFIHLAEKAEEGRLARIAAEPQPESARGFVQLRDGRILATQDGEVVGLPLGITRAQAERELEAG